MPSPAFLRTIAVRPVALLIALCAIGLSSQAMAQTQIGNDSFDTSQQGTIATAALIPDEMYAASFEIPGSLLPAELLGVRVVMIEGSEPGKTYCGRFTLEVWEDDSSIPSSMSPGCPLLNQRPLPNMMGTTLPAAIYSMHTQFSGNIGFQVQGDRNNYQDLLFSSINNNPQLMATISPVILTQPQVRVGLRALDKQCGAASADEFPLMLTDLDGEANPGTNYLYGYLDLAGFCDTEYYFYLWRDMAQFLSTPPGDFVMRLLLRTRGGMDVDMGGMDMMIDMMMSDMGMEDMSSGADMVVVADMTPDGAMIDMHMFEDMAAAQDMMQSGQDMGAERDQGGSDALALTNVSPSSVKQGTGGDLLLLGGGFELGAEVRLNARQIGVKDVKPGRILAETPADLEVGRYDVIVTNPGGDSVILTMGFEVIEARTAAEDMGSMPMVDMSGGAPSGGDIASPDGDGCGCQSAASPARGSGEGLLLLGGVVLVRLRRKRRQRG